jgi:hypothetical protein
VDVPVPIRDISIAQQMVRSKAKMPPTFPKSAETGLRIQDYLRGISGISEVHAIASTMLGGAAERC